MFSAEIPNINFLDKIGEELAQNVPFDEKLPLKVDIDESLKPIYYFSIWIGHVPSNSASSFVFYLV